jgi:RNA polymerase sigma factor for flagellar operon FliA
MDGTHTTEDLITSNIALVDRLVRSVLHRIPNHVSRDDLTAAGLAALVASANAYDPARGVPFSGFAATRIRGSIIDELRQMDWATRAVRRRAREIETARSELTGALNRAPSTAELAERLELAPEEVAAAENDTQRATVLSLDGLTEETGADFAREDAVGPEELLLHRETLGYVRDAVDGLPERHRTVIVGCFVEERSMVDIARQLGVSQSRVSQMRTEALELLHHALTTHLERASIRSGRRADTCSSRRRSAYLSRVGAAGTATGARRAA